MWMFYFIFLWLTIDAQEYGCPDVSIEEAERIADVVFTGRIRGVLETDTGTVLEVQVKHVMKGDEQVEENLIQVKGIETVCYKKVRVSDSRIFLTNLPINQVNPTNGHRLVLSPLKTNLANFDQVNAAVKGEEYVPRPPIRETPCEKKWCPHYAQCDDSSGVAVCSCRSTCGSEYSPVCGTDHNTYRNQCEMEREACRNEAFVLLLHRGACRL